MPSHAIKRSPRKTKGRLMPGGSSGAPGWCRVWVLIKIASPFGFHIFVYNPLCSGWFRVPQFRSTPNMGVSELHSRMPRRIVSDECHFDLQSGPTCSNIETAP